MAKIYIQKKITNLRFSLSDYLFKQGARNFVKTKRNIIFIVFFCACHRVVYFIIEIRMETNSSVYVAKRPLMLMAVKSIFI